MKQLQHLSEQKTLFQGMYSLLEIHYLKYILEKKCVDFIL